MFKQVLNNLWQKRGFRFICVGFTNTVTDATLLNIFVFAFGLKAIIANLFSASIAICISYFLNHFIVFQKRHNLSWVTFLKFFAVTGLSVLAVQSAVFYLFDHTITLHVIKSFTHGLSDSTAKIIQVNGAKIVAVLIGMIWNYILYHVVVFRQSFKNDSTLDETAPPY